MSRFVLGIYAIKGLEKNKNDQLHPPISRLKIVIFEIARGSNQTSIFSQQDLEELLWQIYFKTKFFSVKKNFATLNL